MCISPPRSCVEAAGSSCTRGKRSQIAVRRRSHGSVSKQARQELPETPRIAAIGERSPKNQHLALGGIGSSCTTSALPPSPQWLAPNGWRQRAACRAAPPHQQLRSASHSARASQLHLHRDCKCRDCSIAQRSAMRRQQQHLLRPMLLSKPSGGVADGGGGHGRCMDVVADSCWGGRSARDRPLACERRFG